MQEALSINMHCSRQAHDAAAVNIFGQHVAVNSFFPKTIREWNDLPHETEETVSPI